VDELFSQEDLELAHQAIFDGQRSRNAQRIPLELRVACAISAAAHGARRGVIWLHRKERNHG
jgi:hypothetical protein